MDKWKKNLFIKQLYNSSAIEFGTFQLKSGRMSPYYINMAKAIEDGEGCHKITKSYVDLILTQRLDNSFDTIFGPAYKGIPLSCMITKTLWEDYGIRKRWAYNRKETKLYGDTIDSLIVGNIKDNDRILIVDDVLTDGRTKKDIVTLLSTYKEGITVIGVVVGVDRQEELSESYNFITYSVVNMIDIFSFLKEESKISPEIYSDASNYHIHNARVHSEIEQTQP